MQYPCRMRMIETTRRWISELDRERIQAFARFLWHRFVEDRCFESAGALAYATLFALVPLATVVFGVLAMFPLYETWIDQLSAFVFANFVPSAAENVSEFLQTSAQNARVLPGVGAIAHCCGDGLARPRQHRGHLHISGT